MSARCRHLGNCGGCTLQQVPGAEYRAQKRDAVVHALAKHGVAAEVAEIVAVAPGTRRRAVFKIAKRDGVVDVGFHALKSHSIVDMQECLVLTLALTAFVPRLREAMVALLGNNQHAEAHVTEADNGIDLAFRASAKLTPALTTSLAKAAPDLKAIRITWNGALAFESAAPLVRFGKASVKLPPESFLQPTREGEAVLRAHVLAAVGKAKSVADLFSGCGTFSLVLAEHARVHAVEREQTMLDALANAAKATQGLKPVTTARRDLFKLPLTLAELNKFDAVSLDPPRAGAEAQVRQLALSKVPRLAYVSCDANSFARDAAILVNGGYRIGTVTPVDQFLWSSHIELVAGLAR
ncbi:MAG: class I SAM-dependent RNA methyltransferase [Alphaproteobacteria bacterium]|nr:class I SAM-dependent RNA methyltransferase [Alphaproteobacteria bacterium]